MAQPTILLNKTVNTDQIFSTEVNAMSYLLILIPGITASLSSICIRTFEHKLQKSLHDLHLFQFAYILMVAAAFLILSGFTFIRSTKAWLLAIGFALCLFFSSLGTTQALLCGPMSLSTVIGSCNVILPILFGCIFRQEVLGIVHIIGCVFLLATLVLSGSGPKEQQREISPKWFLYVAMSFFGNGFGAIVLSGYNLISGGDSNNGFLAAAFLLSAALLFLYFLVQGKHFPEEPRFPKMPPLFFLITAGTAFGCFGTNLVLIYLVDSIPTSLLYPIYNGIAAVLTCLVSCLVFRESMNLKKLITIALGLTATVLLNL